MIRSDFAMTTAPSRPDTVVLATSNPGKVEELVRMLGELPFAFRPMDASDGVAEIIEDGETYAENAAKKARVVAEATGCPSLADDSGLEVDALGGAPGVWSARYAASEQAAGEDRTTANNRKLLTALDGTPAAGRTARFRCVMALARPGSEQVVTAEGVLEGRIVESPRGAGGFGYDPLFLVPELGRTVAELSDQEKDACSHRGNAVRAMRAKLLDAIGARESTS